MKNYILASSSPRRKKLLEGLGITFRTVAPTEEIPIINKYFKPEVVEKNAAIKGLSVFSEVREPAVIISADTVIVFNDIIMGKPRDYDDAVRMLKMLSGKTHKVVTAICLTDRVSEVQTAKTEISEVTFNPVSDEIIKDYVFRFKPYDKAGAYGIQELSDDFIAEVNGDYENIVGLPVNLLKTMLIETDKDIKFNEVTETSESTETQVTEEGEYADDEHCGIN